MSCGAGLGAGLGMGCGGAGLVGGLAATNSFRFMLHPTTKNGRRLPLPLGGKRGIEGGAHGCRIGVKGHGDLTRHGRPAHRSALARRRGRALGAAKYEAIPFVGPLLGRPAVTGGPICERARHHREHATGAEPSVKMGLHNPNIGRIATIVAGDRAQRIGSGGVGESCPQPPRGP